MTARTLFSYAFRPFFLLMAAHAVVSMLLWIMTLYGRGPQYLPIDTGYWHAHEMVIGFAMAAVAGFTLTAVATWTGRAPVSGLQLIALVFTWVAGRVVMGAGGILPAGWVALVDMLFPALLFVLLSREVLAAGNARNYPIALITLLLCLLNGLYHSAITGLLPMEFDAERVGLYLLIHLLLLLITLISGRIIPGFTANWLRARGADRLPRQGGAIDLFVIPLTLLTGFFATFAPGSEFFPYMAAGAGLAHLWRWSRWRGLATISEPLLFILHVAYAWLPIGYFLTAASAFGWGVPATAALHALTVGGIALMVLAVSTRVSLAHTGRPLHAPRLIVIAYGVLLLGVVIRVLSPYGWSYLQLVSWSALAWVLTFALFLWVYTPILLRPRVDSDDTS